MDIYEHKDIHLDRQRADKPFLIRCNPSLAQILVSNLLKNAMLHNLDGGDLQVVTTSDALLVRNSGDAPLDQEKLFRRFHHSIKGKKDSNGLGLAIARTIARSASLELDYVWEDGMHVFRLVKEGEK